ncbi:LAME_0G12992g1_1 [Lachancea meyersii CBS 8951]|uniref:Conserved oligomeric Golgi complex subunit 6 n=1 Tax=Lachancea meyersii CBS 8951 TaxID=1266667 RepID=A0A1G4K9U8_9SACH|nr:LAME_0G12992g1_1 [Lachancea meyersii CBS 8951]
MDFLDYQTYGLGETGANDSTLSEPASRIKLQSQQSLAALEKNFQLPNLKASSLSDNVSENLQDKMQKYASMSLELLSSAELPRYSGSDLPTSSKGTLPRGDNLKQLLQNSESAANDADLLLSKKLSRVLNNNSACHLTDIQLRKSFKILEDNEERLNFKSKTVVRPDYVGSLARKTLRSDLENELLRSHLTIIEEIKPIVRRVKRLSQPVKSLQDIGESILKNTSQNTTDSNLDMKTVYGLRQNIEQLHIQKKLLVAIRDKLTLTQVEEETLVNASIEAELFEVINKLMAIKEASSYLLSLENPKAGQTLLAQINSKIEKANKRIYYYLVNFFHDLHSGFKTFGERTFASDDKSLLTFQRSMIYLSNDLSLFNEVLKKIVKLRSQRVLNEFLSQFDFDSSRGSKPIIMSAHDPVRYLGDVLANVHSLIVDEADFMNSMFKFQTLNIQGTPKSVLQENGEFLNGLGVRLLNETFKPSENSIRIRLEQIIRFEDDPLVNFDISELLKLYKMMFIKYGILPDSSLIQQLDLLKESAGKKILVGLVKLMEFSEKELETATEVLPPDWFSEYVSLLCEFFSKLEKSGSLEGSDNVVDSSFLDRTVGQLVSGKLSEYQQARFPLAKKNRKEKIPMLVFEINCLDLLLTRLLPYRSSVLEAVGSDLVYDRINSHLEQSIKSLIALETAELFEKLGLGLYNSLLNMIFPVDSVEDELDYDMYFPAGENPIMDKKTIQTNVHQKLNNHLPEISNEIQENFAFNIVSPRIADRISSGCLGNLSKFYAVFKKTLEHLYPDSEEELASILNFTEQEFDTLIGLN